MMNSLIPLSVASHLDTAVTTDAALIYAASQHLLNVRLGEIGQVMADVPVFFSRHQQTGQWLLSGLYSFTPAQNLWLPQGQWLGSYQPVGMQTYPLLLGTDPAQLMLVADSRVLKKGAAAGAMPLFSENGQPTDYLRQQKAMLDKDLQQEYLTFQFVKAVNELGLIKELDLHLLHADGSSQLIKGLATVDEDKLQLVSAETLHQLQQQGYLLLLHAMLLSISRLNRLIQLHNVRLAGQHSDHPPLKNIKLEISRSVHG
ncbi:hypothetical protein EOE67_02340 [Rheinheimera riviphila]|uniref:SapC family protein n=1 Tax=Rheinheimera riviphila TaxID=1834037 RepID=A0A437R5N9_9GAMM|nr:SapC family protein [Rheinheimera riviphila]RVU42045.1 hypothetical protein EOE67_02340 [Rheinheimera riviphila]